MLAVSKKEKQPLEHLSKQSLDGISCWYMWDFLSLPIDICEIVLTCQTSVFHKKTYTGLLLNYFSFVPNCYKLDLIKTLVDRKIGRS